MDYQLELISLLIFVCSVILLGRLVNLVSEYNGQKIELTKEHARQEKIDNLYGRERE